MIPVRCTLGVVWCGLHSTRTGSIGPLSAPSGAFPETVSVELPGTWFPQSTVPLMALIAGIVPGLSLEATSVSGPSIAAPFAASNPVTPVPAKLLPLKVAPDPASSVTVTFWAERVIVV